MLYLKSIVHWQIAFQLAFVSIQYAKI